MEQIRLIKEMRENDRKSGRADDAIRPRFMVWENVPGAFSSNKGEDFRAVLEETARIADKNATIPRPPHGKWTPSGAILGDGWSIAWRVHDAQFWGVPQRRKRIALVADFGGATAPEILFERESVSRNTTESGKARQSVASNSQNGVRETSKTYDVRISSDGTKNWGAHAYATDICRNLDTGGMNPDSNCGIDVYNQSLTGDVSASLTAACGGANTSGGKVIQIVYGISSYESNSMKSSNPHSGIYEANTTRTLDNNGGNPVCNQGGSVVVAYRGDAITSPVNASNPQPGDSCHTLIGDGRNYIVTEVIPINTMICTRGSDERRTALGVGESGNPQYTITSAHEHGVCVESYSTDSRMEISKSNQSDIIVLEGNGSRPSHKGDGYAKSDVSYTLNSTERHAVCVENHPQDSRVKLCEDNVCQTLNSRMGTGGGNVPMVIESNELYTSSKNSHHTRFRNDESVDTLVASDYKDPPIVIPQACNVRRLTPLECTRLQGFPDGWVDIGDWVDSKGKLHKDTDAPQVQSSWQLHRSPILAMDGGTDGIIFGA